MVAQDFLAFSGNSGLKSELLRILNDLNHDKIPEGPHFNAIKNRLQQRLDYSKELIREFENQIWWDKHEVQSGVFYQIEGMPSNLLHLIDLIFYSLPSYVKENFPTEVVESIRENQDLGGIFSEFINWLLVDAEKGVVNVALEESRPIINVIAMNHLHFSAKNSSTMSRSNFSTNRWKVLKYKAEAIKESTTDLPSKFALLASLRSSAIFSYDGDDSQENSEAIAMGYEPSIPFLRDEIRDIILSAVNAHAWHAIQSKYSLFSLQSLTDSWFDYAKESRVKTFILMRMKILDLLRHHDNEDHNVQPSNEVIFTQLLDTNFQSVPVMIEFQYTKGQPPSIRKFSIKIINNASATFKDDLVRDTIMRYIDPYPI